MDFRRVAETLARFFAARELPYAVVGGVALHAYGLSRTTYDLDLLTSREAQAEVVAFLESLGYETLYRSAGFSNHNHPRQEWGRVDVVYVGGETRRAMFSGVETKPALGLELPVPRAEHLAAMKLHALENDPDRAAQDFADLRYLIQLPEVDQDEVKVTSPSEACSTGTMTCEKKPDRPLLDLERDLPVTPEDVAAQRRLRYPKVEDYLAALSRLPAPSPEELAARRGPRGEPFEL